MVRVGVLSNNFVCLGVGWGIFLVSYNVYLVSFYFLEEGERYVFFFNFGILILKLFNDNVICLSDIIIL